MGNTELQKYDTVTLGEHHKNVKAHPPHQNVTRKFTLEMIEVICWFQKPTCLMSTRAPNKLPGAMSCLSMSAVASFHSQ